MDERLTRLLLTFKLVMIGLHSIAQTNPAISWIDTEVKYTDTVGRSILVYNSLPRGGSGYIDLGGKQYSFVIKGKPFSLLKK